MADTPTAVPADETPSQRAARLRREKRQAKLSSEGNSRLDKITSLGGRPADASTTSSAASTPSKPSNTTIQSSFSSSSLPTNRKPLQASAADDPDEVDISSFTPPSQAEMLRQMLRAQGPDNSTPSSNAKAVDDPMMAMMQQMMGGGGGAGLDDKSGAGLPPGLAEMLGGAAGGQQETQPVSSADYLWRVVHGLFATLIALYAVSIFRFTGSEFSRKFTVAENDASGPRLFALFAAVELVLQTARYFVDRGKLPKSGLLGTVGRMLPEPWAGYVRMVSRYGIIYTTVVSDVMVVVFVLGAAAWWRGEAAS